jgi:hypothetical protein
MTITEQIQREEAAWQAEQTKNALAWATSKRLKFKTEADCIEAWLADGLAAAAEKDLQNAEDDVTYALRHGRRGMSRKMAVSEAKLRANRYAHIVWDMRAKAIDASRRAIN